MADRQLLCDKNKVFPGVIMNLHHKFAILVCNHLLHRSMPHKLLYTSSGGNHTSQIAPLFEAPIRQAATAIGRKIVAYIRKESLAREQEQVQNLQRRGCGPSTQGQVPGINTADCTYRRSSGKGAHSTGQ